ncbi:hypothetical protein BX600DRAFT_468646 [Xylariales sp. PMI_506]|nr:hypothetical protein BX600DRAFT_468646 [Xylariales sp. PMI_506]
MDQSWRGQCSIHRISGETPAFKLLDTYRAMIELENCEQLTQDFTTAGAMKRSETIRELGPISRDIIKH